MPQAIYAALTGKEIKDVVKNRIINEIDKLPYLRAGNTFHRANVQFGFVMQAYPADVPVPEPTELEFTIDAKSVEEFEEALNQIEKADEFVNKINDLKLFIEQANNLLEQALERQPLLIKEVEVEGKIDGSKPDAVRIENNLPVVVEQVKGGKRIEVEVPAIEFKKMMK